MGTNPFDDVLAVCQEILTATRDVLNKISEVRPEWEPLKVAEATRRKGKRTLLAAVTAGLIRSKRIPTSGGKAWLLNVSDLDRHFPVQKK